MNLKTGINISALTCALLEMNFPNHIESSFFFVTTLFQFRDFIIRDLYFLSNAVVKSWLLLYAAIDSYSLFFSSFCFSSVIGRSYWLF